MPARDKKGEERLFLKSGSLGTPVISFVFKILKLVPSGLSKIQFINYCLESRYMSAD